MKGPLRILVTGCTGFIGTHLILALERRGVEVWKLRRDSEDNARTLTADLLNRRQTKEALQAGPEFSTVVHLAAIAHGQRVGVGRDIISVNVEMTRNLVEATSSRDVHFIYFSSVAVYGEGQREDSVSLETLPKPGSKYGKSKRDCEQLLLHSGIENIEIVRVPPVFNCSNLADVRKRVFFPGIPFKIKVRPEPVHSLIHVESVVTETVKLVEGGPGGRRLHQISGSQFGQARLSTWFSGRSVTVAEPLFRLIYWLFSFIPGELGYSSKCAYKKYFCSNRYIGGSIRLPNLRE